MRWLDFEFDLNFGPLLVLTEEEDKFRRMRFGNSSVMEDAVETKSIQETGQEQRPARMAGLPDSDSTQLDKSIEAWRVARIASLRTSEEGI